MNHWRFESRLGGHDIPRIRPKIGPILQKVTKAKSWGWEYHENEWIPIWRDMGRGREGGGEGRIPIEESVRYPDAYIGMWSCDGLVSIQVSIYGSAGRQVIYHVPRCKRGLQSARFQPACQLSPPVVLLSLIFMRRCFTFCIICRHFLPRNAIYCYNCVLC